MIEYIPDEYSWRPVEAKGYMFIHCIFVGFKHAYKGKGYGSLLVDACLKDARKENVYGVAVVTREGPWMAGKKIFEKKVLKSLIQLHLILNYLQKINKNAPTPKFKGNWEKKLSKHSKGLTIFRSDQCPPLAKWIT